MSFLVLVNGCPSKVFFPTCGLHQGDPLSPYLFILVSQVLSANLEVLSNSNICKGVAVSPHSPPISHLFFADGSFFFLNFNAKEVICLKETIEKYCSFAGAKN